MNYGIIHVPAVCAKMPDAPLAASVIFKNLGGKFVTKDGSGNYAISAASDTQIDGWADIAGDFTSSSTAATDKAQVVIDLGAIFEIPVSPADTALTDAGLKTLMRKTCDLVVASNVQYADTDASSTDVIKIVGGNVARNTVYVQINPTKFYTEGVA